MTLYVRTALCAVIAAATLSLNIAPTTVDAKSLKAGMKRGSVAVHPGGRSKSLTTGTQGQAAGQNNTFCGNADVFVVYEEDANGNPIKGTEQYGCTD